jgi:hypothetical protein
MSRVNVSRLTKLEARNPPVNELESLSDEELLALMVNPDSEEYSRALHALQTGDQADWPVLAAIIGIGRLAEDRERS